MNCHMISKSMLVSATLVSIFCLASLSIAQKIPDNTYQNSNTWNAVEQPPQKIYGGELVFAPPGDQVGEIQFIGGEQIPEPLLRLLYLLGIDPKRIGVWLKT